MPNDTVILSITPVVERNTFLTNYLMMLLKNDLI